MNQLTPSTLDGDHTFAALLPALVRRGRPIALVGMMGAGKSALSRQLSVLSGLGYQDTDCVIEKRLGMSIAHFFAKEGEAAFRAIESEIIGEILQRGAAILALGGGTFISPDLRQCLLREADCIFLDVPPDQLWSRVKGRLSKRPMIDKDDPRATFDALYQQRVPIYAEAPIHVAWQSEHLINTALHVKQALWAYLQAEAS
ncbi:MAG: shikimate kinase [Alphaproteobacteria bacterium]|nr:shikimate kinase [Alphaproteobacteria bacterium]